MKKGVNNTNKVPEKKYLVSAIVSTFNSEDILSGCLSDLEKQTISDKTEIVVVNSGSEQNEEKIVKEFQKNYDNIVYLKTVRETIYSAWNRGIKASRGQYIINANTDDRFKHDSFKILSDALDRDKKIDLVYGDWLTTSNLNETYEKNTGDSNMVLRYPQFFAPLCLLHFALSPSPMWRKKIAKEIGFFDPNFKSAGDYDWSIRFALAKKAKHVEQNVGLFFHSQNSVSHSDAAYQEPILIFQKYRTRDNILTLYKNEGYPIDLSEQRKAIFNDMAARASYFVAPWDWYGSASRDMWFAEFCRRLAWEEN